MFRPHIGSHFDSIPLVSGKGFMNLLAEFLTGHLRPKEVSEGQLETFVHLDRPKMTLAGKISNSLSASVLLKWLSVAKL
jgi:hypothetical protein